MGNGDLMRVPSSTTSLERARAAGHRIEVVYSPRDALDLARRRPDQRLVFLAVGFETTAPANAMAVKSARARGLANFSVLVSHVLVPPAISAIISSPDNRVQGFLTKLKTEVQQAMTERRAELETELENLRNPTQPPQA